MSSSDNKPSLIGGHAQYVKGAAENLVGSVTGSAPWSSSGESDKQVGIDAMKQASADRDPSQRGSTMGKVEELAGKATGCEGMEEEGSQAQKKA